VAHHCCTDGVCASCNGPSNKYRYPLLLHFLSCNPELESTLTSSFETRAPLVRYPSSYRAGSCFVGGFHFKLSVEMIWDIKPLNINCFICIRARLFGDQCRFLHQPANFKPANVMTQLTHHLNQGSAAGSLTCWPFGGKDT